MSQPRTVAALYVDPRGPYPKMPGVDCWDEARDARLYDGPHPVVAHPPCGPWGRLRSMCTKQDHYCGIVAFGQVRRLGGVLEHPQGSTLWDYVGAPEPCEPADSSGGRTYLVRQVDWGHTCAKSTWIYAVGISHELIDSEIRSRANSGTPTHVISTSRRRTNPLPELTVKWQRAITPPLFAEWLVSLARSVQR